MPESSLGFDDLRRELDLWAEEGRVATLWWRDDDATAPTAALTKLLDLSDAHAIEVAVAVIPATALETLPGALHSRSHAAVLQHGYAHKNHARPGAKSVECGGDRPVATVLEELVEGSRLLADLFGARAEKILAVPWNRIERPVLEGLAAIGLRGASAYGQRAAMHGVGIRIANAHVDPMNWRERHFAGLDKALSSFLGELRARRNRATDADEPLGLLTHHLDHDADFWEFLEMLFRATAKHPAARWITVAEAFSAPPVRQGSSVAST